MTTVASPQRPARHTAVVGHLSLKHPRSDHPVVIRPLTAAQPARVHFDTPGVEVAFPLTLRHIVFLVEKSAMPFADKLDGTIRDIGQIEDVFDYNRRQVRSSRRQVFCDVDEFLLAAELRDGVIGTRIVR